MPWCLQVMCLNECVYYVVAFYDIHINIKKWTCFQRQGLLQPVCATCHVINSTSCITTMRCDYTICPGT